MDKRVLLVEDDKFMNELYTDLLKSAGYAVTSTSNGNDAFSSLQQDSFDLILLDIVMPTMSGLEFVKKLSKNSIRTHAKKIVFLTNLDKDSEIRDALDYGDGYLIKSQFNPGQFLEEVKKYL